MHKRVEKYKKSGREAIIKSALKKLDDAPDIKDCLVQVKANKKSVIVTFHIPIVYLPVNSVFSYNSGIDLIAGTSWSNIISNPNNYDTGQINIPNYSPDAESKKHIEFVLNAINNSDEIGSIHKEDFSADDSMIIRDNSVYYEITMISKHQRSYYNIDKKTSTVFDSRHGHLMPQPKIGDDYDPYEEIK